MLLKLLDHLQVPIVEAVGDPFEMSEDIQDELEALEAIFDGQTATNYGDVFTVVCPNPPTLDVRVQANGGTARQLCPPYPLLYSHISVYMR